MALRLVNSPYYAHYAFMLLIRVQCWYTPVVSASLLLRWVVVIVGLSSTLMLTYELCQQVLSGVYVTTWLCTTLWEMQGL